jgi:hypothetical protein
VAQTQQAYVYATDDPVSEDDSSGLDPSCSNGASPFKVVGRYKTKWYEGRGNTSSTLNCGNADFGYRHLKIHVGEAGLNWWQFNNFIAQTLIGADIVPQKNGNNKYTAPVFLVTFYGCVLWKASFIVLRSRTSGRVITAFARNVKEYNC